VIDAEVDVLLVQDNPLEVELTVRPLRDLSPDCRIGVARDGEEALDYLLARGDYRHRLGSPLPRVILLDLKLPRLDGVEVLRAIRASPRTGSAPVVMLVPAAEPREVAQCYQMGANSCIRKPVEFPRFYQVIQSVGRYWLNVNEGPPTASAGVGLRAASTGRRGDGS
jgi:two-component system response regulator